MEKRSLSPKQKMIRAAVLVVGLLILLVYCSTYFTGTKSPSPEEDLNGGMEERLASALEKMQGVGDVRVVISYESTAESVPAQSAGEGFSAGEPLILKQDLPEVRGVLVVAEGAEDIRIRTELMYAVTALLDVSADRVEILY